MQTSPQFGIRPRRAHALERARSRASELAHLLADARSSALAFGHVEILDGDRVLDRASALALDISPGGALDLGRARSRASDLANVLDRAYSEARGWEERISRVCDLASGVSRDPALAARVSQVSHWQIHWQLTTQAMTCLAQAGRLNDPNDRGSVTLCDGTKAGRLTGEQMPPGLACASVISGHQIPGRSLGMP